MIKNFYASGKLLLTSEYIVLDGAKAIALPTQKGQSMQVETKNGSGMIFWSSLDEKKSLWFACELDFAEKKVLNTSNKEISDRLLRIFDTISRKNTMFLDLEKDYHFKTQLHFNKDWGWGSSSTLIYNLARWAEVNPYILLEKTFGGSGYDLACADAEGPILYQLEKAQQKVESIFFRPAFCDELFFVYLEKKQDSREAMQHYKTIKKSKEKIELFSKLSDDLIENQNNQTNFSEILNQHEEEISKLINLPTVKKRLFPDYPKTIKSLGAWGGDFVLAMGKEAKEYFPKLGFSSVFAWDDVVLQQNHQL